MPDLFDARREALIEKEQPLAARMRPRTLDEFIGQEHIVGPGRLLRRAIQADQLSSLIFYGPPGTGKTTLARIIANTTRAHFIAINAVLAGVADIRAGIATAQERRGMHGQKTILFVDEVHRFNKSQQDALLPHVENGTVTLIGATTENPYFEVNKALVSRSRIFQLKPLQEKDLYGIARAALVDPERGYGRLNIRLEEEALDHLVDVANGDARAVLNALELAVETTPPDGDGVIVVDLAVAEESIQRRAVLYDKEGDVHFDTISAFIKSLRGSDPDAALYWLAKMIYAGEDPRFMFRRMLIFAGEDVGMADPNAIRVVTSCAQAFDYVGLPEGRFHLAEAAIYLATAPKSNSTLGFFEALSAVEHERESEVPSHLRDANRDREGFGHGDGYLYPHAFRDHWVAQQYLPDALQGKAFYQPSQQGYEAVINEKVAQRREAQLAAMVEGDFAAAPEVLTFTGGEVDRQSDHWLQRTISNAGARLAEQRDRIFAAARLQRHDVALDLHAGSGLLTWEALRRAPEGGVYALAHSAQEAAALEQLSVGLPDLRRPIIFEGELSRLSDLLAAFSPDLRFDAILGRNALTTCADKAGFLGSLLHWLTMNGRLVLANAVPRRTQRLYELVDVRSLADGLADLLRAAEETIYADAADPAVNWDVDDLAEMLAAVGFEADVTSETVRTDTHLSQAVLDRWFGEGEAGKPSYRQRLGEALNGEQLGEVEALYRRQLTNQTVAWATTTVYITATRHE
ncbi:MAG: AAA family ATPase [Caldilineales bacterium]|nr:AAA family ATPase [Caldilineales bacterium]